MIYQIRQLETLTKIDTTLDLNDLIQENSGIISINNCQVTGVIKKEADAVIFDIHVNVNLVLACNITLNPVAYDLDFDAQIVFSDNLDKMDFVYEDPVDLRQYVYAYILMEKPTTVYSS